MENTPNPQSALRRFLVVLAIVIGFVVYSYGWTVTQIDLELPQEEQRQTNVTNALRELLSPNIFTQDREVVDITTPFLVGCEDGRELPQPGEQPGGAVLTVEPTCGDPGDVVSVSLRGSEALAEGRVRWVPPGEDAQVRPRELIETGREDFVLTDAGSFDGTIEVPRVRGSEGEIATVMVRVAVPVGAIQFSDTSLQVFQRMMETIFMALVATSIAIPVAALISFFAAQNIMQPIKLSVGSMLLSFLGVALGLWLGAMLLGPVAEMGVSIGNGSVFGAAALIIASTVASGAGVQRVSFGGDRNLPVSLLIRVGVTVAIVFVIGFLGGFGQTGAVQIAALADLIRGENLFSQVLAGAVDAIGNLLRVLSELTVLFTPLIGAVAGATLISGIATDTLSAPLRRTSPAVAHVLGGVLGALGGAVLLGALGAVGTWAALLGLLTPIAAGLLGGVLALRMYRLVYKRDLRAYARNRVDNVVRIVIYVVGLVAGFFLAFTQLNVGRAIIDGTLPPQNTVNFLGLSLLSYVARSALLGALLGGAGGALAGVRASFPVGGILYNVSRSILNTVRSIEPLIMGLVFVIWVGIGPFAGVLALTLHSIAALGKLYSEQIENIDDGPVEALESTGATRLQTIVYAVVPQIIPPYIAFTMYRWDINVRMSTIIGFVGGGGIGLLLQQQINLLRYREAGVAVLAIALVVSALDYASASIRSRIA